MLDFLGSIGEAISIGVQFITSTVQGILSVFSIIAESTSFLTTCFSAIPAPLLLFASAGIAIVIVLQLIGR